MGSATDFVEVTQSDVYLQPQTSGFGNELGTQIHYTIELLKKKKVELPIHEILRNLSLINVPEARKVVFVETLRRHALVAFIPQSGVTEQKWNLGCYSYRPVIPEVNDKISLLECLDGRPLGVAVTDLKDYWCECEAELIALEDAHNVLVTRTRGDGNLKHVYPDEPSLWTNVDEEFKEIWHKISIQKEGDLPKIFTTRIDKAQKKLRKGRLRTMGPYTTNKHMESVLKDFSHLRHPR